MPLHHDGEQSGGIVLKIATSLSIAAALVAMGCNHENEQPANSAADASGSMGSDSTPYAPSGAEPGTGTSSGTGSSSDTSGTTGSDTGSGTTGTGTTGTGSSNGATGSGSGTNGSANPGAGSGTTGAGSGAH